MCAEFRKIYVSSLRDRKSSRDKLVQDYEELYMIFWREWILSRTKLIKRLLSEVVWRVSVFQKDTSSGSVEDGSEAGERQRKKRQTTETAKAWKDESLNQDRVIKDGELETAGQEK